VRVDIEQSVDQLLNKFHQLSTGRHQLAQQLCHIADSAQQDVSIALGQLLLKHDELLELPAGLIEDDRLCENLVELQQVLDAVDREQADGNLRIGHAADDCAEYVAEIVEIVPNLPGGDFIVVGKMAENCGQTSHGPQALVVVHGRQPGLQILEDELEVVACHVLVEAGVQ